MVKNESHSIFCVRPRQSAAAFCFSGGEAAGKTLKKFKANFKQLNLLLTKH